MDGEFSNSVKLDSPDHVDDENGPTTGGFPQAEVKKGAGVGDAEGRDMKPLVDCEGWLCTGFEAIFCVRLERAAGAGSGVGSVAGCV